MIFLWNVAEVLRTSDIYSGETKSLQIQIIATKFLWNFVLKFKNGHEIVWEMEF